MQVNTLTIPYIIKNFHYHNTIKNRLLGVIEDSEGLTLSNTDNYFTDNISKYDWHLNKNFQRPWVRELLPFLDEDISQIVDRLGFKEYFLVVMWYQQYLNGGTHGWHTHSDNFTGVYYLELPIGTPKTQIINPVDQSEIIDLEVKEGDIVLFPSFVIHRAPINCSNERKTIISFDLNIDSIKSTILDNITQQGT